MLVAYSATLREANVFDHLHDNRQKTLAMSSAVVPTKTIFVVQPRNRRLTGNGRYGLFRAVEAVFEWGGGAETAGVDNV